MALGLKMPSLPMREVSDVPGGCWRPECHRKLSGASCDVNSRPSCKKMLPSVPTMFSERGLAGSSGGNTGLSVAWQIAQVVPTRYGGSIDLSPARYLAGSPRAARNLGLGNL